MSGAEDTRLLALLVHRGLVPRAVATQALGSGDPRGHLLEHGGVSPAQWDEWVRTEGGARPELTRYELGDSLGEGGTARVFRAVDRTDGATVALKILKPALAEDPAAVKVFISESKLLMDLDCPHIVRGFRVAREGSVFFCAMECIEGRCLQDELGEDEPLDETVALRVVMHVGKALAFLHDRGFVHRDVKPGNVMMAGDGRAVLIDLGFAVGAQGGAQGGAESETTAGTVHYISPEQARGQQSLDVRADIYSLGATLYHLVTGSLPFAGATHEEVMAKQVLEALSGEAIRAIGLSPQTHYFIEKMMAKEKEIRFQSPAELVSEIDSHLATQERERKAEADAQARRKPKRRLRRFM